MFALQTLGVALRNVFAGEIMRRRVTDELARLGDRELADMGIKVDTDAAHVAGRSSEPPPATDEGTTP